MSDFDVRQDQEARFRNAGGQRQTLRRSAKQTAPKGHEAFLKALETSGVDVAFVMASRDEIIVGKIKTSDKYTVSVTQPVPNSDRYLTRVLFKHDISEFQPLIPAPTATAGE